MFKYKFFCYFFLFLSMWLVWSFLHHRIHLDAFYLVSNKHHHSLNSINYQVMGVLFCFCCCCCLTRHWKTSFEEYGWTNGSACVERPRCLGLLKYGDRGASLWVNAAFSLLFWCLDFWCNTSVSFISTVYYTDFIFSFEVFLPQQLKRIRSK